MKFSWQSHNSREELQDLCEALEDLVQKWNLSKRCGFSLLLTIDEWFNNLIMHTIPSAAVQVDVELGDDEIIVTVVDDCPPFDPLQLETPDTGAPLEDREIGGLGVFLIRKRSKRFEYERRDNKNILKITLYKD